MNTELRKDIIDAAYGKTTVFKKIMVSKIIRHNEDAAKLFEEHKRISRDLNSLENISCPDEIVKSAQKRIHILNEEQTILEKIYFLLFSKPLRTAAIMAGIVFILVISSLNFNENRGVNYSENQIIEANRQTKEALAIIGKVFLNSQQTLETNIMGKRVGYPIRNGIKEINKLFN